MGIAELRLSLFVLFIFSMVCNSLGYVPPDNYLIDCGSRFNTNVDTRVFVSDESTSRLLSTPQSILANTTTVPSGIYRTARIFTEDSSYTFRIQTPGRHWIRLHFYPFIYQTYNMSNADFSVSTQQHLLLGNFQPSNGSDVKEFSVNITSDNLVIRFTPNPGSFAFLNALEVVSVPDTLITEGVQTINPMGNFQGLWRQALETSYRVNMGGPFISPSNDTLGRTWVSGDRFLRNRNLGKSVSNIGAVQYLDDGATIDSAPAAVYGTATEMNTVDVSNSNFNVTWEFDVDPEFEYLVRFHFCDIVSISLNQLYFNVYLASRMVLPNLDLSQLSVQTLGGALYRDFIVQMGDTRTLSVSIGPTVGVDGVEPNAILNGLEVMKMNNSRGGLDVGSLPGASAQSKSSKTAMIAGVVVGIVVLLVAAMVVCLMRRRRRIQMEHSKTWVPFSTNGGTATQSIASKFFNGTRDNTGTDLGYRIPFLALQEATNKFNESWVIGVGGFGKVYKGVLKDGTKIAVKRGNPQSQQGLAEFRTEIEMLSQFRHRHLVSLIGYCDERNEMILIYEYMENGTLKSHLYGSEFPSLDWKQRLEICIGSARGLHYLHTGSTKAVIHRDVKSANILLDENLMAKVADFGLSKAGPDIDQTHVSTAVKGSFGYLDPEYFRRQQLTEKSDVYSFGVVLFEVLCARPVIDPSLPRDKVNLAEWVMKYQTSGKLEQIIDPFLVGKVRPDSLRKFGETAEKCLAEYGVDRPSMADVLWNLEYALQLQEAGNQSEPCDNSTNQIGDISPLIHHDSFVETSATAEQFRQLEDISGTSMSRVFSQLVKAEGR